MADDWNSLQSTFGLNAQDIASLKSQGMNPSSATDFLTKGIGGNTLMQGPGGMSLSQLISLGSMFGGGKGGTGGQGQSGSGLRNYQAVGVDPNQPMTNLGAAALQQNAIYNPQPGGTGTGGDTGVTGSGGAGFAGGGGLTIGGISTQQPTITTSGVVPTAPKGPWNDVPSLFNKATAMQPTAPLALKPTPQATGVPYTPGQSWATPPSAPGLTIGAGGGAVPMPMGGGQPQMMAGGGMPPGAPGHVMMPTTPTPGLTMHPNGYEQGPAAAGATTALATKQT